MNATERRSVDDLSSLGSARWLAPMMRATESIAICNTKGAILFWNESSERLYGWRSADVLGRSLVALGCEIRPACWEKALSDGHWSAIARRRRRDGTEIDVYLRCEVMGSWGDWEEDVVVEYASPAGEISSPVEYAPGPFDWEVSWLLSTESMSGVDRQTDHSSTDFARYLQGRPEDVFRSLNIVSVSEIVPRFFGKSISPSSLTGRPFHSLWPDRYRETFISMLGEVLVDRPSAVRTDVGTRLSMRRGERHSGQIEVGISGTWTLPNRVWELEASEDRYQRLLDNIPLAVWQVDSNIMGEVFSKLRKDGVSDILAYMQEHTDLVDFANEAVRVTAANELAVALLGGMTNDQLLGPVGYLFKATPGAAMNVMAARFNGQRNHTQEMQVAAFDGRVIDVMFMVSYPHQGAAMDKTMLMMVDISDRLRIESQLKQIEADFARATRLSTLGEMVGSIVHEVRQPLSAIMTDGETSLRWLERDDINVTKLRQINARIVESASQASGIVDKIREMAVRQTPVIEAVSFNDIVLQAIEFVQGECGIRSIAVLSQLDPDLPTISGDAIQLQQVAVNLLMNALYAIGTVQDGQREIRLRTHRQGAAAVFVVEDSGPGIPNNNFGKIFERFFSTKEGGMGMGLAICKSIVDAHGGTIAASSASGGGAVLTVTLPAVGVQAAP